MAYDLHVHSNASDGVFTPKEIVNIACQLGLKGLALTDHDTVEGLPEFLEAGSHNQLDVITGIEINTDYSQSEIHILGYGIDPNNASLLASLDAIKEARLNRGKKMVDKLRDLGMPVDWEAVSALAAGGVVGRPHIARAMMQQGYATSMEEAFKNYLSRGRAAYVPRYKLSPEQAIAIIRQAGGIPVLAHPGLIVEESVALEVARMVWGIEVYYPEHSPATTTQWQRYAEKNRLLITGGSDFHGPLGVKNGLGCQTTSENQVNKLRVLLHDKKS